MRRWRFAGLLVALIASAPAQAFDDAALAAEADTLKQVIALGGRCGDRLDVDGRDAIASDACAAYTERFASLWQTRDGLNAEVAALTAPYQNGDRPCDEQCARDLVQLDQLKTMVIYFLDYIDFLKTM